MGKAQIKPEVFRKHFAAAVVAVEKDATDSKNDFVPVFNANDTEYAALEDARSAIEDTGIRLHGYDNMVRVDPTDMDSGYTVNGATGGQLANFLLGPVKRFFRNFERGTTFVMAMDQGPFMPRPKHHTQAGRTSALVGVLENKNIVPLRVPTSGAMPLMIDQELPLPPWVAVRANRTLYRHATAQLLQLIERTYKPPAGKRLIIDCIDTAVTSPATLDDWMQTDRVVYDDYARSVIEKSRALLRDRDDWRKKVRLIINQLGHGGHLHSVPVCIETSADGVTYAPFLLHNAVKTCGEADIGILYWVHALSTERLHKTLRGKRHVVEALPKAASELGEYYTDAQRAENSAQLAEFGADALAAQPEPFVEQCRAAQRLLDSIDAARNDVCANQSLVDGAARRAGADSSRAQQAGALLRHRRTADMVDLVPNRALVFSSDTDFLSLLAVHHAQRVAEARDKALRTGTDVLRALQRAECNAPVLSIGNCRTLRCGALRTNDDYYVLPPKAKRDAEAAKRAKMTPAELAAAPPEPVVYTALEVWDIARLWEAVYDKLQFSYEDRAARERAADAVAQAAEDVDQEADASQAILDTASTFALFCASCENDYLAGLCGVNRVCMFDALLDFGAPLVHYNKERAVPVVEPAHYANYIKHCYHQSMMAARGKANKPPRAAREMSYEQVADVVAKKHKTRVTWRMPDAERLQLMYQRSQWWLVYAMLAWRGIDMLLDDTVWGWPEGSTALWV